MTPWVWMWLIISIGFEVAGDYFVKTASNTPGFNARWLWVGTLFFYNLMLLAWMVAIQNAKQITIPGMLWLVGGQLTLVLLGIGFFGEHATLSQKLGVGLSVLSVALLSA